MHMKRRKNILDRKYFKELNIDIAQLCAYQLEQIEALENEYKLSKPNFKFIALMLKYNVINLKETFERYLQYNHIKAYLNDHTIVYSIFDDDIAKCIISHRKEKYKVTKYSTTDKVTQLINGYSKFSMFGISLDTLTNIDRSRIEKVINYPHKSELPSEWENLIPYFIIYNLCNFLGRLKRLKKVSQSTTSLLSFVLRYGKQKGMEQYNTNVSKITNHFTNKKEFWTNQGFDDESAIASVSAVQTKRAKKSALILRNTSEYSCRSVIYWIKKGYTISDAKTEVYKIQTSAWVNASEIDKEIRIKNWLKTLNSKPESERELINLKKGHSPESYMAARGIEYDEALQLSISYYKKRNVYSAISQKLFWDICDIIGEDGLYFYTLNYEKQIGRKCIDFFDSKSNIAIEFLGDYWHANPKFYKSTDLVYNKRASDIWKYDNDRKRLIEDAMPNINIIEIWESDYLKTPGNIVLNLVNIINETRGIND